MEALDALTPPQRFTNQPLRFSVEDVYKIAKIGTVVTGRVLTGMLKTEMEVVCGPELVKSRVVSMEMYR